MQTKICIVVTPSAGQYQAAENIYYEVQGIIKRIEQDGWYWKRTSGSHQIHKHPSKRGTVIVAYHGAKDVPEGTLKSILTQAGLE